LSGWIKLEKDLPTDPRFRRMVRAYCNAEVTQQRISPAMGETLLLGCVAKLWMYADTHVRSDDTLDMSADEIDELVGITGFCQVMPTDWLQVLDPQHVKLPGFQEHNGTDAKKKALTQKRVERHRIRTVTQERIEDSGGCNASALPDQTRPDQTIPKENTHTGASAPRGTEPKAEICEHVTAIKAAYPKGGRTSWAPAEHYARNLVLRGEATWSQLLSSVERYARNCTAYPTRAVMNPTNFFSASDQPWSQAWDIPPPKANGAREPIRNDEAAWQEAEALAKEIGFRPPGRPAESVTAYMREVKNARDRPPPAQISERLGLAGLKRISN